METIWLSQMVFRTTGPLTFRRMPSGILHIISYPFMPPTTMSGFLRRLLYIAEQREWPGYGTDWYGKIGSPGRGFTLTMESQYRPLGAFPQSGKWSIHKTRRHGPKNFKHAEFSQVSRTSHEENYQLHHWDYLFCEKLIGWVAAKTRNSLERLNSLKNFGGKAGKEGYLFVSEIGDPQQVPLQEGEFQPLGLVIKPFRPISGAYYNLYGHHWNSQYEWTNGDKGGVDGYTQLGAWWNVKSVIGPYWAVSEGVGIPAGVPDAFLSGDVERFYGVNE